MPSYQRPGIYVSEFLKPNNTVETGSTTDAVFIGGHHRGPADSLTYIRSWTQFQAAFGGFPGTGAPTELPYAVYNYFSNGGGGCYIYRLIGTGAATATVTLVDRAGVPVNTLTLRALNEGAWGNNLRISIVDRDTTNGRFDLIVYSGGTTDPYIVERWLDLTMTAGDPRFVETVINSDAAGSRYIEADALPNATAAPNNMPAAQSGTALTGGADGTAPGTTEYTAAVSAGSLLDTLDGIATLNMPGQSTAAVINTALSYAEGRGTLFVIADPPAGSTPAATVTWADSLSNSSYGAAYSPHLVVPDANTNSVGATRLTPPGAFIAAKFAETDTSRGVWKAPAGLQTAIGNVVALERRFSNADLDDLNEAHVNAIRQVPGSGVVVMGARTLKSGRADMYVNVRRTLNFIKDGLVRSTDFAIFENNDYDLWERLTVVCQRFLGQIHAGGGLRGISPAEAFYVKCDGDLNTPEVIASGEVRIEIGVALQYPAEFVVIRIGQWEGGQSATEA